MKLIIADSERAILVDAVVELLRNYDVPDDVFLVPDFRTGNIIVIKGAMGFCVSGPAIAAGWFRQQFGAALQRLIELEDSSLGDPAFVTRAELRAQRASFD